MNAIGAMRARIALYSPERTLDELGGASLGWTPEGEAWAQVEAAGAAFGAAFDTAASNAAYRMTIHRRDEVRAGWRVVWDGRALRIMSVRDEGAPRIVLNCEEETL
jgi:SPP1 family predicted phage head-tail adaptor